MAPLYLSPELKARVEQTYAGFAAADPVATRGVIRVSTRLVENCRSQGELEGHAVVCDEPAERGGTGQGPAPLYYFLASLGF
jgi:hypothetical protein